MKRLLTLLFAVVTPGCGLPPEPEGAAAVGVAEAELTSAVPFWWGHASMTTGHGALTDAVNDGVLGWRGPEVPTPFGAVQTPAFTFDVEAQNASGHATLTWHTFAQASGDHRLLGPSSAFVDGYARARAFFQSAGVDVYVIVRVRVNGAVRKEVWHEVAVVSTTYGERTSSFTNLFVPLSRDFTIFAKAGDAIKYEVLLFTRARLGNLGSAFVGVRDFGVLTNAVPNTDHTIEVRAP